MRKLPRDINSSVCYNTPISLSRLWADSHHLLREGDYHNPMLDVFKQLVREYGYAPNIRISKGRGRTTLETIGDVQTIYIYRYDTKGNLANYAEMVFFLLHEYRHVIQLGREMFPQMKDKRYMGYANDTTLQPWEYFSIPWEKDANEWAYRKGIELGFWYEGYKPRWLYGITLGGY